MYTGCTLPSVLPSVHRLACLRSSLAVGQRYQFLAMCIFSWGYSQLAAFHRGGGEGQGGSLRWKLPSLLNLILEVAPCCFYNILLNRSKSGIQPNSRGEDHAAVKIAKGKDHWDHLKGYRPQIFHCSNFSNV